MISIDQVLFTHNQAIKKFGGLNNIRDKELLESALNRPFATFAGIDLYPTNIEKISALTESIIKNHPFHDGNKRIGYLMMRILLRKNHLDIFVAEDEKYDFIIKIAEGKLTFDEIVSWIQDNTRKI
jgi:death-on-curing protein